MMKGQVISHTGEEISETMDIILTNNEEDTRMNEVTEDPHLSKDNNRDLSNAGSIKKIVEHVCGECHKTFRTIRNFKKHIDFCRFNSRHHVRKAEMLKNLEKIENDAVIMENTNVCFCCGESYDTYHIGQIKCSDCPKSFKTQLSYERHIFIIHAEFDDHSCSICNAKLRSVNLLKLHEEQHRNRDKPFACEYCGKQFSRSNHMIIHQQFSSCSPTAVVKCKVCNKAFQRIGKLRKHLKRHLEKKLEIRCPVCKKCFHSSRNLNVHSRIHTGERPFECDLCAKKFRVLAALKRHRRSHTGEKPYDCSVCKQSFSAKEAFNRHMKGHTGERPHVCSECGKGFIRPSELRSHTKAHIRRYECNVCTEKFKTEKQLDTHFKKYHKCETCKIRFKTALEYNKHMKENVHATPVERRRIRQRANRLKLKLKANQKDTINENPSKDCMNDTVSLSSPEVINIQNSQGESSAIVTTNNKGRESKTKESDKDTEIFVNENPSKDCMNDTVSLSSPEVINNRNSQGESSAFVTTNSKGPESKTKESDKETEIFVNENPSKDCMNDTVALSSPGVINIQNSQGESSAIVTTNSKGLESKTKESDKDTEIFVNENPSKDCMNDTVSLSSPEVINIQNSQDESFAFVTTNSKSPESKTKKNETLVAAIANDKISGTEVEPPYSEEDLKLKNNVRKLLDKLVDSATLTRFGWPNITEDIIICKVIEYYGYDLSKEQHKFSGSDYSSRMREYVKLFLIIVIQNEFMEELLNIDLIDEAIEYVLNIEDDDQDIQKIVNRKKIQVIN